MDFLGAPELIVILVLVVLLFGAKKLPSLARSLGESKRAFKQGAQGPESAGASPSVPPPPVVDGNRTEP